MPNLRPRSVGKKNSSASPLPSPSPAVPAAAAASTSTPKASLNKNNNESKGKSSNPPAEVPSNGTPVGLDPLTPAGEKEHAPFSSAHHSKSLTRPQTRAAKAAAASASALAGGGGGAEGGGGGTARKTRQRFGKKALFADQKQDQKRHFLHEEGEESVAAGAAEITVTRRTGKKVRRRSSRDPEVESIIETAETSVVMTSTTRDAVASGPSSEMAEDGRDGVSISEKGKRKAVVALSDSDEEEEIMNLFNTTDEEEEEEKIGRNGSSSMDVVGDGSSGRAARGGGQSPRGTKRTWGGPSRRDRDSNPSTNKRAVATKAKFLEVARRRAAHFAHFAGEEDEPASSSVAAAGIVDADLDRVVDEQKRRAAELLAQVTADVAHRPDNGEQHEDQWPGPFVIARQLVEGRESAAAARHESTLGAAGPDPQQTSVVWVPSRKPNFRKTRIPTSLHDMCVEVLCANIEHVTSLEGVPDAAKKLICSRLCAQRIMTPNALRLYFESEPGEVIVPDCTFVTEETLTEALAKCSTQKLEVLELGLCGRAMSDQLCASTLAGLSCSLPILHTLVLNGAYRLTDVGLKILVNGTPNLSTLSLKQCNMVSAVGLEAVANFVGNTLKTLSLESCAQLDALKILSPLLKMSNLESLSLSGLCGMSDGILSELAVILGPHLRELYIADCRALTDAAIKAISLCCSGLKLLDMGHLPSLTDAAIGNVADGCRSLRVLRLDRGKFSDTTLAALITASGNCLTELSLNSVRQAGDLTLSALAKHSKGTLEQLDLSFCRSVSDQALGVLADTCEELREIRLFGCTQVTDFFLEGHSNPGLNVIGMPRTFLDVSCSALKPSRKVL
ncbi:unnamed protein product [Calypogeia fissa]